MEDGNIGVHPMELLEEYISESKKDLFKDVIVLHINHCMKNTDYFNQLFKRICGKFIFVVPPYNNRIPCDAEYASYYTAFSEEGYCLKRKKGKCDCNWNEKKESEEESLETGKRYDFTQITERLIYYSFKNEIIGGLKMGMKLLLLEDGGYHYPVIKNLFQTGELERSSILGVIEQTTAGTRNAIKYHPPYPVYSVAHSLVKVRLEPVFIARRIVDELGKIMFEKNHSLYFQNTIIIGYGIIGRQIGEIMKGMKGSLTVIEKNFHIAAIANAEGYVIAKGFCQAHFKKETIVIGCTGMASFGGPELLMFLESCGEVLYLVSASSKQVEFSKIIHFYMEGNHPYYFRTERERNSITWNIQYHGQNKRIVLIAYGYPVNFFDKNQESLNFSMMEAVFCEMLLLARYASEHRGLPEGIHLLGDSGCKLVDEELLIKNWFYHYGSCVEENFHEVLGYHKGEAVLNQLILGGFEEEGRDA